MLTGSTKYKTDNSKGKIESQTYKGTVKSYTNHKADRLGDDVHFLSPLPDISLHQIHIMCLFTSQLLLALIVPSHGWMARLS